MSLELAKKLYSVYIPSYQPPAWVLSPNIWTSLQFRESCLYYDQKDNLDLVFALARQREPVNMAMKRGYDLDKMEKEFGYRRGAYGQIAEKTGKVPPIIGIYAHTPVKVDAISFKFAHVINLIGLAMDSPKQPDHELLKGKHLAILEHYIKVWRIAFHCCRGHGLKYLHTSYVGGGAFAPEGTDDYIYNIYNPVIEKVSAEFPDITLIEKFYPEFVVPYSFQSIPQTVMDQTLYVNAWDPWSIVGNGNGCDESLDGYWGRSSALAVLCWPIINDRMDSVPLRL